MNNVSGNSSLNLKIKNYQKGLKEQKKERENEKEIKKEIKKENIIISNIKKEKKEEKEKNINIKLDDTSDIDEDLKNDSETLNNKDIIEFMNSFIKEHPLEKMDEIKEPYELMIYTKNIINDLLNYQLNYYSSLIHSININKKFNQLLLNYNEKYRLALKKINKINEETKKNEIKQDLINNKQNFEKNNLKK